MNGQEYEDRLVILRQTCKHCNGREHDHKGRDHSFEHESELNKCAYHGEELAFAPGVVGCHACGEDCKRGCTKADCNSPRHYLQPTPMIQDFKVVKIQ